MDDNDRFCNRDKGNDGRLYKHKDNDMESIFLKGKIGGIN